MVADTTVPAPNLYTAKKVVVWTTWWLPQFYHVGHVGDNTITYNVEKEHMHPTENEHSNSILVSIGYPQFM